MNLYKIWRDKFAYDEFDSAVVVAKDEEAAKCIIPVRPYDDEAYGNAWIEPGETLHVEYIGEAAPNLTEGTIIVASYNAG